VTQSRFLVKTGIIVYPRVNIKNKNADNVIYLCAVIALDNSDEMVRFIWRWAHAECSS
jgi:hypothetical protein